MKFIVVILTCFIVFGIPILADEEGRGFYGGIGFGSTAFEDDGFVKEEQPTVKGDLSVKDKGAKVYLGYQVNKIVGLELGFTDYGSFYAEDYVHKTKSTDIAVNVGYTFLEGTLRPYMLVGLGYIFNDFPHNDVPSISINSLSSHIGLGLDYTPVFTSGFGIRVAFEADGYTYGIEQGGTDTVKEYQQTLGILYLGVHYKY